MDAFGAAASMSDIAISAPDAGDATAALDSDPTKGCTVRSGSTPGVSVFNLTGKNSAGVTVAETITATIGDDGGVAVTFGAVAGTPTPKV